MKFKITFTLLSLLLLPSQVMANEWAAANKRMGEEYAIPRYQALQDASKRLVNHTNNFCLNVNQASFNNTRKQFLETMNAWQQVQLLRLGPAELYMRHFRLEMWPDRSNAGAKQISALLSEKSLDALNARTFTRASTAVQGLPAMERLLYANNVSAQLFSSNADAHEKVNYRCELLKAISVNIHSMSLDLLNDWRDKYLKEITHPGEENDYFETDKEVSTQFLKELATQLQAIMDQKLKRPMDGKRFRPRRAESWRSGHSLHNIVENLKSTEQLFQIGFAPLLTNKKTDLVLKKKLGRQFEQAIKTGERLDMSLKKAYRDHKTLLDEWILQISLLKNTVTQDLPKALDLPLGFNSLDGD